MRSGDVIPPSDGSVIGTPLDYSEDLYEFYLETVDVDGTAERVLTSFLGRGTRSVCTGLRTALSSPPRSSAPPISSGF